MRNPIIAAAAALCLALHAADANAALITVTSRGALGGDSTVDWGQLQPDCQDFVPTPLTATSTRGLNVEVSHAGAPVALDKQFPPGCIWDGWNGDFAPGDALLWSGLSFGYGFDPLTLTFSNPVYGVGTQFGYALNGLSFAVQIDAFNGNQFLGSVFNLNGYSTDTGDNSAIFLGLIDTSGPNITSIVLSVINTSGADPADFYVDNDFSVNQLSLREAPEPASLLLAASGLVALIRMRRKAPARRVT